jgi:hypothetical protein
MAQGPVIYNALIMPLSSSSAPPRPRPEPPPGKPPVSGQPPRPDHTLPGDLPRPEHPIYFPLPPNVPPPPYIDNTLPGDLPHPDQGLPGDQPHPDHELPGAQPRPEHPIVLPPDSGHWDPVYIWGGPGSLPTSPHPDHDLPPIEIPEPIPPEGERPGISFKPIWTPMTGWIVIGVIEGAHVTPSKGKKK